MDNKDDSDEKTPPSWAWLTDPIWGYPSSKSGADCDSKLLSSSSPGNSLNAAETQATQPDAENASSYTKSFSKSFFKPSSDTSSDKNPSDDLLYRMIDEDGRTVIEQFLKANSKTIRRTELRKEFYERMETACHLAVQESSFDIFGIDIQLHAGEKPHNALRTFKNCISPLLPSGSPLIYVAIFVPDHINDDQEPVGAHVHCIAFLPSCIRPNMMDDSIPTIDPLTSQPKTRKISYKGFYRQLNERIIDYMKRGNVRKARRIHMKGVYSLGTTKGGLVGYMAGKRNLLITGAKIITVNEVRSYRQKKSPGVQNHISESIIPASSSTTPPRPPSDGYSLGSLINTEVQNLRDDHASPSTPFGNLAAKDGPEEIEKRVQAGVDKLRKLLVVDDADQGESKNGT